MAGEEKKKGENTQPTGPRPPESAKTASTPPTKVTGDKPLKESADAKYLEEEENNRIKFAFLIAVAAHLILIWWNVWPEFNTQVVAQERDKAYLVKRFIPKKPPPQKKEIQQLKKKKVPIPDPTPDEPEPIVEPDPEPEPIRDDLNSDFIVGIPEGPPVPDGPVRAGFGATTPEVIHRVDPVYPELARRAKVQGTVILEAIIRRDGTVGDVKVLRSLGKLGCDEAAIAALKQWRFQPGEMNGHPVDVIMTLTIKFVLE